MRSRKAGIPRDVAALRPAGLRLWARHVGSAFRRCLDGGCSAGPGPERRGSERISGSQPLRPLRMFEEWFSLSGPQGVNACVSPWSLDAAAHRRPGTQGANHCRKPPSLFQATGIAFL